MTRRTDSGSSRSPMAVEPATSQNSTVTVLRASRTGSAVSAAPQALQKAEPSGFSRPQFGQVSTTRQGYGVERLRARRARYIPSAALAFALSLVTVTARFFVA